MARSMLSIDLKRGVVLAGAAALLASCAQDPGVSPNNPDNCILICALVRSFTGEPEAASPPQAVAPAKKPVHVASAQAPGPQPVRPPQKKPVVLPVEQVLRTTQHPPVPPEPPPEPPPVAPVVPPASSVQLPGSAPIAAVTSRFVPPTTLTP